MAEIRSFKQVLDNNYYDDIYNAISSFIDDNPSRIKSNSSVVKRVEEATLDDIDIKNISINDSSENEILVDVVVEAEIEIFETIRRNRESDSTNQWLRVSCSIQLNDGIQSFQVNRVTLYSSYDNNKKAMLSDSLVPYISKDNFDKVAEEFLQEVFPEALLAPMPIPTSEVASRLGLTIKEVRLTKHFTLFGQIYFSDCVTEYFDEDLKDYIPLEVNRGTILVDPHIYFLRNVGCMNNTIIHECFHWYKHKKYHELEKLYNPKANLIRCRVNESTKRQKQWEPEDWMEWQANGITPRILMPASTTKLKIEELIQKNKQILKPSTRIEMWSNVLFELAEFFGVSKVATKIRMMDLGYMEVEGVYTYVDDHYVNNYGFANESLNKDQTYSISLSDAFFEYFSNKEFTRYINSGNFVYVDGHYVINNPSYIRVTEDGVLELTEYARNHVDECCLIFNLTIDDAAQTDIVVYKDTVMYRKATKDYNRVPQFHEEKHNMELFNRSEELKRLHAEFIAEGAEIETIGESFSQLAFRYIEAKGYNRVVFAQKTLLSEKTYDRLKKNEVHTPSLDTVMAICIGLKFTPAMCEELLKKAGFVLGNSPQHVAFKKLIYCFNGHSIYECNEVLEALGLAQIKVSACN